MHNVSGGSRLFVVRRSRSVFWWFVVISPRGFRRARPSRLMLRRFLVNWQLGTSFCDVLVHVSGSFFDWLCKGSLYISDMRLLPVIRVANTSATRLAFSLF